MFLKVLDFPKIWSLIFKVKTHEAKNLLENLILKTSATKVSNGTFKIMSESLLSIPKVFEKFKELFSNEFFYFLFPFSLYLFEKNPEISQTTPLRTGKIYFENSLKKELENSLKGTSVFYKITNWFELGEIIFSVNVDPKVSFFFKDIFLTGKEPFCFFCHSSWHNFKNCPGLLNTEPWKTFELLLNENLFQFPDKLWKNLKEKETPSFTNQEWNLFYTRYFFLFPSFLKIISYGFREIESWKELNLQLKIPIRGGDLGLSLEALETRKLKESEEKASHLEDKDFRKSLILSFCALLKEKFDKTIYYLEDALEKVSTNFLKSYILFLKGYLAYYRGDLFLAEEFLDKAFKIDPFCFPAFYFLILSRYHRGQGFLKMGSYLGHPWILTWSYLDPLLIKNQKEIEDLLEKAICEKKESAVKRLKEGEDKFFDLKPVMDEVEIKKYSEKIENLRKRIYEGGLNSVEKAEKETLELILELQAYIYNQIKRLQEILKEIIKDYEKFKTFWDKYPYKNEDILFETNLKEIGESINIVKEAFKKREVSKTFKLISNTLKENREKLNNLKNFQERLKNKWFFRNRLAHFLKVFFIGEGALIIIYLTPLFLAPFSPVSAFLSFSWFIFFSLIILIISLISVKLKHSDEFFSMD